MTRINTVPVGSLTDQHLFAEWRELKMVPKSLRRSLRARGTARVLARIPKAYCLGVGHVTFFYDKGAFLANRYAALGNELAQRGYKFNALAHWDDARVYDGLTDAFFTNYTPTPEALALSRLRIRTRIEQRPGWYKFHGKPLPMTFLEEHYNVGFLG